MPVQKSWTSVENAAVSNSMSWWTPSGKISTVTGPPMPSAIADNSKPVLYAAGDKDPNVTPDLIRAIAGEIGGPVSVEIFPDGPHQLMLFETEAFSTAVHDFCTIHA